MKSTHFKTRELKGRPQDMEVELFRIGREQTIIQTIEKNPGFHHSLIRDLIVVKMHAMAGPTFDTDIARLLKQYRLREIFEGKRKFYKVVDATEQLKQISVDIPAYLALLQSQLDRLEKEYSKLHLVDKIVMSIAYMRNNLDFAKEIKFVAVVADEKPKLHRDAQATIDTNMREIKRIVEGDKDKDKVLPHLIAASQKQDDFGIFKTTNQTTNGPVEMWDKSGNLVYRNFPPYVDKRKKKGGFVK